MLTLEERVARLERLLTNEIVKRQGRLAPEEMASDFEALCKSWSLVDFTTSGNKVTCSFDMKQFSRRIQRRMRHATKIKLFHGDECQLICDTKKEELTLVIKDKKVKVALDEFTHVKKEDKDHLLSAIGRAVDQYLELYYPALIN